MTIKRLLALLLCFVILLGSVPTITGSLAYGAETNPEIQDLNDKYSKLEKEQKALQNKIDKAKNDKEKQLAIKEKTSKDINILESQIAVLKEKIVIMEQEIAKKEEEVASLNNDIDDNYQLFKNRMRAIYMADNSSTLGLVLGADSYGDFLARSETVKRVADHDKQFIADLTAKKENLEAIKADLDSERTDLEAAKVSVEAKNNELDGRLATTVAKIQDLNEMEKEFLANKDALQKQMKEVQDEIDAVYASLQDYGEEFVGGMFCQPVPGYSKITSYYGWRFGGTDFHTGLDFSGPGILGKTVVAANTGIISVANDSYTSGRGYGRYIIVDHGGGYTTLYGHLSAITVNEGDRVQKGQPIGKVGNTGWSTGPHTHFEVRINGKHKDPLGYLRG